MMHREGIIARLDGIESLPVASSQIVRQLNDPNATIDSVVRALECSPELTTNVLRLANSAQFGSTRTLSSVREALIRLGSRQVMQLVMASSVAPIARGEMRGYDLSHGKLLEHSIAVGIATDLLARQLERSAPADTFTAGLLHDLGKIALNAQLEIDTQSMLEMAFKEHVSFEQAEARILGMDHAEAGAFLLERWSLPEALVAAVRFHHQPDGFRGDSTTQYLVDLVHVADILVLETGIGTGIDGLNYQVSPEAAERLSMQAATAEAVVCSLLIRLDEMREVLEVLGGR